MNNKFYFPVPMILFLIFMVLNLTDQIDWSWWWITAPVWGGFLLILLATILAEVLKAFESPTSRAARLARQISEHPDLKRPR